MAFRVYFTVDIVKMLNDLQRLQLDDRLAAMAKTGRVSLHDAGQRKKTNGVWIFEMVRGAGFD